MRSRNKEPMFFDGYVHDMRGPMGAILSVCCEGPSCEICVKDPAAKSRADAFKAEHYGRKGEKV